MEEREAVKTYKTINAEGTGEITEKKSRFIATLRPVKTQEEAAAFIEEMKKKYWDARHNCSAFVLGKKGEITRFSDDGEPGGTAGKPMLEVLLSEELRDVAVVVTRYFGGTLLGTGGLLRAYQRAVKEGLLNCGILTMRYGVCIQIQTDYSMSGKVQYLLEQRGITEYKTAYTQQVCFTVMIPFQKVNDIKEKITEATGAKAQMEEIRTGYFVDKM